MFSVWKLTMLCYTRWVDKGPMHRDLQDLLCPRCEIWWCKSITLWYHWSPWATNHRSTPIHTHWCVLPSRERPYMTSGPKQLALPMLKVSLLLPYMTRLQSSRPKVSLLRPCMKSRGSPYCKLRRVQISISGKPAIGWPGNYVQC